MSSSCSETRFLEVSLHCEISSANFKILLNFSFVSDIRKIWKIIQKFFLERLDCMNCMLFPINSAFPSPYWSTSIRVVNDYAHCNARLRFFCGPHYQLNNEYRQKIRLKIVCKNENDPISFFDVFCVKSLNNEMMSVSVIEKRKN